MNRPILLARLTLSSASTDRRTQLDVRRGANDELVLSLGIEALSNLQPKRPPPAFCIAGDDYTTVEVAAAWVNDWTLRRVVMIERGPSARQTIDEAAQ